ncbi:TPA: DNA circularization protein [Klebsiella variicola]|nr:DNA circularization protein [Klebsiella variicola]
MFESTVASINSVRDSMGLKGQRVDGIGSFRNVPFLTYREQKESGGRRIVKREYPLRDAGGAIDLGRKLRERTFSACLLGKNVGAEKDNLIEALEAPGAGELTHPDFGTLQVLIDSYECRKSADELDYYEFTITVYPAAEDSAPESATDTAAAVSGKKDSLFGELGDTLSDAWQTVQEATDGAIAVADAISGIFDDIAGIVENAGVMGSVNGLLSSLAKVKGSAQAMINAPALLAANLLGALSGFSDMADSGTAFQSYERLGVMLKRRQSGTDTTHLDPAATADINSLYYVVTVATQASQAEAASAVLTDALNTDTGLSRTPELTTSAPASSVAQASPPQDSATGISSPSSGAVVSDTASQTDTFPLFESQADIEQVASDTGRQLDDSTVAASDAGFTASSLALATFRLVVVNDLLTRGVHLPDVRSVSLSQTEPALVALYRETGDSLYWQRMGRRNSIPNPLFMPGGVPLEILDG